MISNANNGFVQQNMTNGAQYISFEVEWHGSHTRTCMKPNSLCMDDLHSFPLSLTELLLPTQANAVELSMTRGLWRQELWGIKPVADGATGAGALLRASFSASNSKDGSGITVGRSWRQLKASIAATVCAALNDNNIRSSPFVQHNEAWMSAIAPQVNNYTMVMQYFPVENVCTENVRAWAKWWTDSNPIHDNELTHVWSHSLDWLLYSPWYSLSLRATNTPISHGVDSHAVSSTTENNTTSSSLSPASSNLYAVLRLSAVLPPPQRQLESHKNLLERIIARNNVRDDDSSSLSKPTSSFTNRAQRESIHYSVVLRRDIRDSRRDFFTANTSITISPLPLGKDGTGAETEENCLSVTIVEALPDFYDLMLHSYQYYIHSKKKYVADLLTFSRTLGSWSDRECFGSSMGGGDRSESLSSSTRTQNSENDPWQTYRDHRCLGTLTWSLDIHRSNPIIPLIYQFYSQTSFSFFIGP